MRLVCLFLALSACGGSNGTPGLGSGGGALAIAVDQVTQPGAIGAVQP